MLHSPTIKWYDRILPSGFWLGLLISTILQLPFFIFVIFKKLNWKTMTKEVGFYFNCWGNFGKLDVSWFWSWKEAFYFWICFQAVERAQTKTHAALLSTNTGNQTTNHGNVSYNWFCWNYCASLYIYLATLKRALLLISATITAWYIQHDIKRALFFYLSSQRMAISPWATETRRSAVSPPCSCF